MSRSGDAVDIFKQAARLNREDPLLNGSLLVFPNYGQLVMTGDLHGNERNFAKLQRFCDLGSYAVRHVVLHEIIHNDLDTLEAKDESHELLLATARWKIEFPEQVHFLLSNHELAQITGNEISKNGRIVTLAFEEAVRQRYGAAARDVLAAMYEFISSYPLAGRTPNRVFISHSLPSARDVPGFDESVLERVATDIDLRPSGSAHSLVWGRHQTASALETLRQVLDVDFFLCGHQPQETGYEVLHDCMIILASEHNHGTFLTLDLSKPVTLQSLTQKIRKFAEIA